MRTTEKQRGTDHQLADEVSKLKSDLSTIREDIGGLASSLVGEGYESAQIARERAGKAVRHSVHNARKQVSERPIASMTAAACVGLLVGWAISRR